METWARRASRKGHLGPYELELGTRIIRLFLHHGASDAARRSADALTEALGDAANSWKRWEHYGLAAEELEAASALRQLVGDGGGCETLSRRAIVLRKREAKQDAKALEEAQGIIAELRPAHESDELDREGLARLHDAVVTVHSHLCRGVGSDDEHHAIVEAAWERFLQRRDELAVLDVGKGCPRCGAAMEPLACAQDRPVVNLHLCPQCGRCLGTRSLLRFRGPVVLTLTRVATVILAGRSHMVLREDEGIVHLVVDSKGRIMLAFELTTSGPVAFEPGSPVGPPGLDESLSALALEGGPTLDALLEAWGGHREHFQHIEEELMRALREETARLLEESDLLEKAGATPVVGPPAG
ncbi:MAG: hypothetical protein QF415_01435 [Candidatus Undinarchaeales archaeon]|nr:hypothetical protein [Candidatus Undinarchaeales archaeon]MDP7493368.1 hypothetical protein [Candidatus Undinarchaeales archaeon]